jgi:hypothetical protein
MCILGHVGELSCSCVRLYTIWVQCSRLFESRLHCGRREVGNRSIVRTDAKYFASSRLLGTLSLKVWFKYLSLNKYFYKYRFMSVRTLP